MGQFQAHYKKHVSTDDAWSKRQSFDQIPNQQRQRQNNYIRFHLESNISLLKLLHVYLNEVKYYHEEEAFSVAWMLPPWYCNALLIFPIFPPSPFITFIHSLFINRSFMIWININKQPCNKSTCVQVNSLSKYHDVGPRVEAIFVGTYVILVQETSPFQGVCKKLVSVELWPGIFIHSITTLLMFFQI